MFAGTSAGTDGVALIGRSKSLAIVAWGSPAVVTLDEEPQFVAPCGDAVVVGLRSQLVFVSRRNGTWEIERIQDQLPDICGFASDATNNNGVAWSQTGSIYLVRRSGTYQPRQHGCHCS
jgi:hypothetical protein